MKVSQWNMWQHSTYPHMCNESNRNSGESKREEKMFEKITAEHFPNAMKNFISKTKKSLLNFM